MPTCVVTGGAGFIGSHLAERLLLDGWRVHVLDNFLTGSRANAAALGEHEGLSVFEGDVRNAEDVEEALAGASVVFHQAALPSVPRSIADPQTTNDINVRGTLTLLQGAVRAGVERFVYASSSSAYGDASGTSAKVETQPPAPRSPYAVSKLAGEMYCRAFADTFGLGTVCIRYFNVFGPRQDPDSPYAAVVPKFLTAMLTGQEPVVFGDGNQSRDFTYVENIVRLNLLAATADCPPGSLFNGGSGVRTSLNDVIEELRAVTGYDGPIDYREPRPGDVRHSLADLTAAREVLGYEPTVSLGEGVRRTMGALRASLAEIGADA